MQLKRVGGVLLVAFACVSVALGVPRFVAASYSLKGDFVANSSDYKYSVSVPDNWVYIQADRQGLKGGGLEEIIVTQQGDTISRPAKWFDLNVGSSSAVFGLSPRIAQKLSNDQLVDFYIDQSFNSLIDFTVTKTDTRVVNGTKQYVVQSNYLVPGPYRVMNIDYFEFKNNMAYHWSISYFTTHASYADKLQSIADGLQIF